jgi:hypothetical protein
MLCRGCKCPSIFVFLLKWEGCWPNYEDKPKLERNGRDIFNQTFVQEPEGMIVKGFLNLNKRLIK